MALFLFKVNKLLVRQTLIYDEVCGFILFIRKVANFLSETLLLVGKLKAHYIYGQNKTVRATVGTEMIIDY